MSWLLENLFGSKESLEQVREDIHEHLHKESYIGISGIDNPEQSATRVTPADLELNLFGPWGQNLEEVETELLQLIHDELPPVVRDEVGILPFFTNTLADGYLVLTFIRNASSRDILLNQLPLALVTPDGEVVARKTFDMIAFGPIADMSSRPCEFMFRWNEFDRIPEEEVPLSLVYVPPVQQKAAPEKVTHEEGLSVEEESKYQQLLGDHPVAEGQVDLKVLDILAGADGGLKVIVLFRNGLDRRLEFTEVPILIRDKQGTEVATVQFGIKNLQVEANGSRIWAFSVPADSMKNPDIEPNDCTAFIPEAKPERETFTIRSSGLIQ